MKKGFITLKELKRKKFGKWVKKYTTSKKLQGITNLKFR
jgi:hypothetical protein